MDIVSETFLQRYFLYNAVVGRFCDTKLLYETLARVFFLDEDTSSELWELVQNPTVKSVETNSDAMRYNRIVQYNEMCALQQDPEEVRLAVALKCNALRIALENKLLPDGVVTRSIVYNCLLNSVECNNVLAMCILGTLQCEGLFVTPNLAQGMHLLDRACMWGDTFALLTAVWYCSNDRKTLAVNASRLCAAVQGTEYGPLFVKACRQFSVTDVHPSKETVLLYKLFASKRAQPQIFDPMCAKLLFCDTVSYKDKEKILFSENKALLSEVCDLPLKLTVGEFSDLSALGNMPVNRKKEQTKLRTALHNADLRQRDSFRPICMCCNSDFMLELYADALVSLGGEEDHVVRIDVADLKSYDLEPTGSNVFVRLATEGKNNVYLLVIKGEIEDYVMEEVKQFLISEKRSRFLLNVPRITLDLSPILPVCICTEANSAKLFEITETINVADPQNKEKRALVEFSLRQKSHSYLGHDVAMTDEVADILCKCSVEIADGVIDKILTANRFSEGFETITAEMLSPYTDLLNTHSGYGFGGSNL